MYAKIFAQIYDGTLCTNHPWQALVTFQQLLVLADRNGNLDMTARAISRRTGIPQEVIDIGIAELLLPDPESRTPEEEGRRIVPLVAGREWGWKVVNYAAYHQIKSEEDRREYHRRYYQKNRSVAALSNKQVETQDAQLNSIDSIHVDVDVDVDVDLKNKTPLVDAAAPTTAVKVDKGIQCPTEKLVELYHTECKTLARVARLSESRKAALRTLWRTVCKEEGFKDEAQGIVYFEGYFNWIEQSDFLCGRTGNGNFVASFDWILKQVNFTKIIEGNYHRRAA